MTFRLRVALAFDRYHRHLLRTRRDVERLRLAFERLDELEQARKVIEP